MLKFLKSPNICLDNDCFQHANTNMNSNAYKKMIYHSSVELFKKDFNAFIKYLVLCIICVQFKEC